MQHPGIYAITNVHNGNQYVGSAKRLAARKNGHMSDLRHQRHHSSHLQHAWNKYGEKAFEFSVLELCDTEVLTAREQWWLDTLRPIYNVCPIAGRTKGVKRSAEAIRNMPQCQKGRVLSEEHRKRLSEGRRTRTTSAQTREKMSRSHKGRIFSDETRRKISAAKKGVRKTEAHKQKLSEANLGKTLSATHRANVSLGLKRFYAARSAPDVEASPLAA